LFATIILRHSLYWIYGKQIIAAVTGPASQGLKGVRENLNKQLILNNYHYFQYIQSEKDIDRVVVNYTIMLVWHKHAKGRWVAGGQGGLGKTYIRGQSVMLRKALFITLTLCFMSAGEAKAGNLELTSGNVFGLWTNINSALLVAAELSGKEGLVGTLEAEKPSSFSGKSTSDVLAKAVEFHQKLKQLIASGDGAPAKNLLEAGGAKVTPGMVYLNSGLVLDSLVMHVYDMNNDQLIGGFYATSDNSGKSPSDVFSLADLAGRRIDLLAGAL